MRVFLTMLALVLLYSCNGVKQSASVESGGQSTTNDEIALSYTLSTITANDTTIDNGDAMVVTVNLKKEDGSPFVPTVPLTVMFYSTGGTSRGTFSGSWDNGNGSYSAIFAGTISGTATKIRALVNMRDIVTTYPTVTVQSAELAWTPAGHEFEYVPVMTSSPIINFVLKNSGNKVASSCGAPVISDTANFSIVGDTCGTSNLNPNQSCTVQVEATPLTTGLQQATLSRSCLNTGVVSTYSQRIRVTGVNPVNVSWAPLTANFGTIGVGNMSASQTFTFTNTGAGTTIGCDSPVLSDPVNFKITSDNCNRTNQASGGSCSVSVSAVPTLSGALAATLSRRCSFGGTVRTTSNGLTVTAVAPVALAWSPLTKAFPATVQGQKSASFVFTLTNSKSGTATGCSAPVLSNATDFAVSIDNCGTSDLPGLASCQVYVQATPQSTGDLSTTLSRTCSFEGTPTTMSGGLTVSASASLALPEWSLPEMKLGEVTNAKESNTVTAVFRNRGTLAVSGCSAPVLSDPVNFSIVQDNCGTAGVSPSGVCTVKVKSTPAPGDVAATLTRVCAVGGTAVITLQSSGAPDTVASIEHGTGAEHTCVLMDDDVLKCWGANSSGQLGTGSATPEPAPKKTLILTAAHFSTQAYHSCAALTSGSVVCWGKNTNGQLGSGSTVDSASPVTVKLDATTDLMNITKVATGEDHSCALQNSGKIFCWGLNSSGQLGTGTTTNSAFAREISNPLSTAYDEISAGLNHTCALDRDLGQGFVSCWGKNSNGQVGDTTIVNKLSPTLVDATFVTARDAIRLGMGGDSSCIVRANSTAACWGKNDKGQLGDGSTVDKTSPRPIATFGSISRIHAGLSSSCAVTTVPDVRCSGSNALNQLGNNAYQDSTTPRIVSGSAGATQVSVGRAHACALYPDGSAKCWGDNGSTLRLGDADTEISKIPQKLVTLSNVLDVAHGLDFSCAVDSSGLVFCWGRNGFGQLGDGSQTSRMFPGAVTGISTAVEVEAGADSACALLADSSVACWGNNQNAAFGNGTTTSSTLPVATGLTGVTSLKMGMNGGCALLASGSIKCWGSNGGDVGNNTTAIAASPVTVTGISTATAIAKGQAHSCALLTDKTVKCWGQNSFGQLGNGSTAPAFIPGSAISNLTNVARISSRRNTTCVVLTDKTVRCWGQNNFGQVGDGTTANRTSPVSPLNLSDVNEISAGGSLTCATRASGKLSCFGNYLGVTRPNPVAAFGATTAAIPVTLSDPCFIESTGDLFCWGLLTPGLHSGKPVSGL